MDATLDGYWLLGDPQWWGLENELPPDYRKGELIPNNKWTYTTPRLGNIGWIRQRLKPLAHKLLFPMAWAPFFLILTIIPLAIPGKTPDDQVVSLVFFLVSWFLIVYPLLDSRDSQSSHINDFLSLPIDWNLLFLGIIIFPVHIIIEPRIGWISYSIFCIAMYRTFMLTQEMMKIPPSRFLIPVDKKNWNGANLSEDWIIESNIWRVGVIARAVCSDGSLVVSGIRRSKFEFISIAYVHKTGFIQDPFFKRNEENLLLNNLLENPFPIISKSWPKRFLVPGEEE